jgi:hypothetical protein
MIAIQNAQLPLLVHIGPPISASDNALPPLPGDGAPVQQQSTGD